MPATNHIKEDWHPSVPFRIEAFETQTILRATLLCVEPRNGGMRGRFPCEGTLLLEQVKASQDLGKEQGKGRKSKAYISVYELHVEA